MGESHHVGTTLRGATTEGHVLRGKRSSYKRRAVRPLQSAAPNVRSMSASSTFEYANADFQRERCSRNLPFNFLYLMTKAFRTLQCYVIPIRLCAPYTPASLSHW
ncbi:hypothetical protein AVEN_205986-1 [Araneus ventricosus]|uniref:Uncharacterized protein n=1 Tax=Araneus ventricosus TaxID=182803 RepID=A0A4Y2KUC0_ARAVE|nr:hypothetical protein AVEN_205986-1 [Araneus ventricosus]